MEDLKNKIKDAYTLKLKIAVLESEMKKLSESKKELESYLEEINSELLKGMIEQGQEEIETDDHIFATHYVKSEFSYGDEKELLKYLQRESLNDYINIKTTTTTSINKNALKKALKSNQELKESLKDYVGDRKTEYVVVVDAETHQKMLEHIEEGE